MNFYLKTSLRNLFKNKIFSLINILGLALSLTCALAIFFIVQHELSYDSFHENKENIYRLAFDERPSGRPGARLMTRASPPAGPALKQNFPEVLNSVRFRYSDMDILSYKDNSFYEKGLYYVDSTLFSIFSFDLKYGNEKTALTNKNSVILSESMSQKYFGDINPLGEILELNNQRSLIVTGVFDGPPDNSHLPLDIVLPFHAFEVPFGYPVDLNNWSWVSFHTYLLLEPGTTPEQLQAGFTRFAKEVLPTNISDRFTFGLQPLGEVYMDTSGSEQIRTGNPSFIYSLSVIGLVLLVLATLNYINLNTARLISRSKEVGIRKVLGALKAHIAKQFIFESTVIMLLSATVAVILFSGIIGPALQIGFELEEVLTVALLIALPIGIISSIFPIWSAIGLNTINSLRGKLKSGKTSIQLRKTLITIQFIITISLITSSILIRNQLNFIQSKDLGYDQEQIILLEVQGEELRTNASLFETQMAAVPGVDQIALSGHLLDGNQGNIPTFPEGSDSEEGYPMNIIAANAGWLELLDVELVAGHTLTDKVPIDSSEIVINEAALATLELTADEAIGMKLRVGGLVDGRVVGVVRDFNFASLHSQIRPLAIFHPRTDYEYIFIKTSSDNFASTIENLRSTWENIAPNLPFSYSFLDDTVAELYESEQYFERLIEVFTLIAIVLATFGLYGLVSFVVELELKTIAIRKVLGAKKSSLYLRQLLNFVILIAIALLIGAPIVVMVMSDWLNNFAYHIDLGVMPFLASLGILTAIVVLTISHLLLKAIGTNPLKIIRSE